MHRVCAVLVAVIVMGGCESDEAKLERFQLAAAEARGSVLHYEQALADLEGRTEMERIAEEERRDQDQLARLDYGPGVEDTLAAIRARNRARLSAINKLQARVDSIDPQRHDSILALLDSARTRATLAERDLNRFLRGD